MLRRLQTIIVAVSVGLGLSACDGRRLALRVEPQIGTAAARRVVFHPILPFRILVVEAASLSGGTVGVWDIDNPERPLRTLTLYAQAIDACFTPDGNSIVTAGADGKVRRWSLSGEQSWESQTSQHTQLSAISVDTGQKSPTIVSGSADGTLQLWNLDGTPIGERIQGHKGSVQSIRFDRTGTYMATTSASDGLVIWKRATAGWTKLQDLRSESRIVAIGFSPSSDSMISAGEMGLELWSKDGEIFKIQKKLNGENVRSATFSRSGDLIIAEGKDGAVAFYNGDGTPRGFVPGQGDETLIDLSPSNGADIVAATSTSGTVHFWSLDGSTRPVFFKGHATGDFDGGINDIAFFPSGKEVATAGEDGTVRFWDIDGLPQSQPLIVTQMINGLRPENKNLGPLFYRNNRQPVESISFSHDGTQLITGDFAGFVQLWKRQGDSWIKAAQVRHAEGEKDPSPVSRVAFHPTKNIVASAGWDGKIKIWDSENRLKQLKSLNCKGELRAIAFSPDGEYLAAAGVALELWKLDGTEHRVLPNTGGWSYSVSFSPDGRLFATGDQAGTVRLWNLDGSEQGEPLYHGGEIWSVVFSRQGNILASASKDRSTVRLWNIDGSPHGRTFDPFSRFGYVGRLAFSPDGSILLGVGPTSPEVHAWNLNASPRGELPARPATTALAVSATGSFVAAASGNTVRLWNPDGTPAGDALPAYHEPIKALALSRDGRRLVTAGGGELGRIWNLTDRTFTPLSLPSNDQQSPGRHVIETFGLSDISVSVDSGLVAGKAYTQTLGIWTLSGEMWPSPLNATARNSSTDVTREGNHPSSRSEGMVLQYTDRGELVGMSGPGPQGPLVAKFALSDDGQYVVAACDGGLVRLWSRDGQEWREKDLPTKHTGALRSAVFAPHGHNFATAGEDGTIRIWNPDKPDNSTPLEVGRPIHSLAFGQDGDLLVGATDGDEIFIFRKSIFGWKKRAETVGPPGTVALFVLQKRIAITSILGIIDFMDLDLTSRARMFLGRDDVLVVTATGAYNGIGEMFRSTRVFTGSRELSPAEASSLASKEEVVFGTLGSEHWSRMIAASLQLVWVWWLGLSLALQGVVLYSLAIFVILLVWIIRPAQLAYWTMIDPTRPPLPTFPKFVESAAEALSLVRYLGSSRRSLRAVLLDNYQSLDAKCFSGRESVVHRSIYAELGAKDRVKAWEHDLSIQSKSAWWISGAGGSGKSTLAFEMARRAASYSKRTLRLIVLIEEDWKPTTTTDSALLAWVSELLQIRGRQFATQMTRLLLRAGNIVMLIDGFSERQVSGANEQVAALLRQEIVRYLLVTSRDTSNLGDLRTIEINPLEDSMLEDFVDEYLAAGYIVPDDRSDLLSAVRRLTGGRTTRPLFVRLAIERYKNTKSLPGSYPDLIQEYVLQIKPQGVGALDQESFLRAARIAAYACVSQDFRPRWVTREFMLGSLGGTGTAFVGVKDASSDSGGKALSPSEVLDQLVRCGLLQQDVRVGYPHVGFWEDTIADYLAAMYINMLGKTADSRIPKDPGVIGLGVEEALRDIENRQPK